MRGTTGGRRRPVVVALVSVAVAATLSPPAAGAQGTEPFGLDLEGEYRMELSDDPAYADPAFDDAGWTVTTVPSQDGHEGAWDDFDGVGWFRRSFVLPAEAEGQNLVLSAGFLDDADETYLNGVLVGRSGSFNPDGDSQWFERRLYPVPAGVLEFGGTNVLAVRVDDFSGGGGWYKGPVGLFSKERLRQEVYGIAGTAAPTALRSAVLEVLDAQADALSRGDLPAYLATLDAGFVHDGQDRDRRRRELVRSLARFDRLELVDANVEVLVTPDGSVVVDTDRSLTGVSGSERTVVRPATQEFLRFDATTVREVGNRSRFFRDRVDSALEGKAREFVVYLPPSYHAEPDRRFPTVYLLHGINGGAREWEPREFDRILDELFTTGGLAESIVVFPDGESLWYIDSSVTPWRSMFVEELLPLVDAEYRTLPQREFRGLSGVSMGGHGAFTVGWANPDLFSSIATHMGALDIPPLVGTPTEVAANSPETPVVQAAARTPEFLSGFAYYMDACRDDDFRFAEAAEMMSAELTAKLVEHTLEIRPEGRHNDDCWLPHVDQSFGLHSASFRASGLDEGGGGQGAAPEVEETDDGSVAPAPTPSLPSTGGGASLALLLGLAGAAWWRPRRSRAARPPARG